tara:strand:+ start:360 stop:1094 length:735 start_codon:yes stop_codon:yes gene_type:complete
MSKIYVDNDKYGYQCEFPISEAYNSAIKAIVRERLRRSELDWEKFVFDGEIKTITKKDMARVEQELLDLGYRFEPSAMSSSAERPEAYKDSGLYEENFSFEHEEAPVSSVDENGREQRGAGDNVVARSENLVGVARYVRTTDAVMELLSTGVPDNVIAIVDDAGGTLTAPVLERFSCVLCAGGTTRSHLAILTREYNIPCLMNTRIAGIFDGDRLEVETTAVAKTADDYDAGREVTAHVWRLSE